MGDISTWNPVDNSNTTAPPDGWPEGMAPSGVNNCARAMMGAVRRWYDTVTAQLASLTTSVGTIANYLPLSGGTLTGTLTAPQLNSNGNVSAGLDMAARDLTLTRNLSSAGTVTAAQVNSTGGINASGGISAGLDMAARDLTLTRNLWGSGTVTAAQLTSTGNINAAGTVTGASFIGNVTVPAGGTLSTTGTVTGGQVTSTGNMNASGNITASSDLIAGNNITAGNKIFTQHLEVDQDAYLGVATINDGLQVTNGICYNQSGSWVSLSDATLKDDIAPYRRGLDAVLALNPVSFRYRPEVFGDDSAQIVHFGLVADEVAPLVPEMVGETMHGDRAVSTLMPGHLVWCLINAAKDLAAQNAALSARITALEGNQTHE